MSRSGQCKAAKEEEKNINISKTEYLRTREKDVGTEYKYFGSIIYKEGNSKKYIRKRVKN